MRYISGVVLTLALMACSDPQATMPPADVNAAAAKAQGDIDTYAANTPAVPAPTPTAARVGVAASPSEPPIAADGAQAAADVVQRYFARLEARDYAGAYALWDNAGMSARQFADSFGKYATYHATVGAPGRIDAGAGQRYVEVPVRVYGTLVAGPRPFAMRGTLTLHQTADIDGATAAQRRWRIRSSSLRPSPAEAATAAAVPTVAHYRCAGATRISVRFDSDTDTATVLRGPRDVVLAGQRPASGIWYKGDGFELRGKGDDADFTAPGRAPVACTAAE